MMEKKGPIRTSESVTEGHPDKVCDRIADAILDAMLAQDPKGRLACEVMATTGIVFIMGEISSTADLNTTQIVRDTLREIGYTDATIGLDAENCAILTTLHAQSPDIAQGVDHSQENREGDTAEELEQGAGDQGVVFGYACDDTPERMPMPLHYAHRLAHRLAEVRKENIIEHLRPDGKTQISIEYDESGAPRRVDAILISAQHDAEMDQKQLKEELWDHVVRHVVEPELIDSRTKFYVNPTGRFEIGGPNGDTGLTGRKIIVDTYGGAGHHGGGSFSGKDPSKVDRSAAYYARYVAKNLVAAGLAKQVEIAVSYAIGRAEPFSYSLNTFGTGVKPDLELLDIVKEVFDFRPAAIIKSLDLRRPIYAPTAAYGHFGRLDVEFPWEKEDKVDALRTFME